MTTPFRTFTAIAAVAAIVAACAHDNKAAALDEQADSIAEQRDALHKKQETTLAEARADLAHTDSLLALTTEEHDRQHQWVMEHATELEDNAPEVQRLNKLRARKDSLTKRFGVLAETIKYIQRKQRE